MKIKTYNHPVSENKVIVLLEHQADTKYIDNIIDVYNPLFVSRVPGRM